MADPLEEAISLSDFTEITETEGQGRGGHPTITPHEAHDPLLYIIIGGTLRTVNRQQTQHTRDAARASRGGTTGAGCREHAHRGEQQPGSSIGHRHR